MRVYLCGAIFNCGDSECTDWRETAKKELLSVNIEVANPMDRDCRGLELSCGERIVEDDKRDIDNSTHLLVNYEKPSVGTSMEVLYAWERGKQVLLVCKEQRIASPWMLYHAHSIFSDLGNALEYLKACGEGGDSSYDASPLSVVTHPTAITTCGKCGSEETDWVEEPRSMLDLENGISRSTLRCRACHSVLATMRTVFSELVASFGGDQL